MRKSKIKLEPELEISERLVSKFQKVFFDLQKQQEITQKRRIEDFLKQNRGQRVRSAEILAERLSHVKFTTFNDNSNATFGDSPTQNDKKKTYASASCFDGFRYVKTSLKVPATFLPAVTPLPPMTVYESTKRNCYADDESKLNNIPYINDEVITAKKFVKNLESHYEGFVEDEESRFEQMMGDELFVNLVQAMIPYQNVGLFMHYELTLPNQMIFQAMSQIFSNNNVDPAKLRARYFRLVKMIDPENKKFTQNIDGPMEVPESYEKILKSYKAKFCRRCFMYGCLIHEPSEIPPMSSNSCTNTLSTLITSSPCGENCTMFLDGTLRPSPGRMKAAEKNAKTNGASRIKPSQIWTASDQSVFNLCRSRMTNCQISRVLQTKTCAQVYEFDKTINFTIKNEKFSPDSSLLIEIPTPRKASTSRVTEGVKKPGTKGQLQQITRIFARQDQGANANNYTPCIHDGPCSIANKCKCIESSNFCEKFCGCSQSCRNRFPGCICKGKCNTKLCVCFSVLRECDPDLCKKCGSHEFDVSKINCKNVNLQRGLSKHILLGKSDISGWGAFIKDAAKKDEFISEYTGELISKSEGDRRAAVYDERNHSFLFHLNNQFDVDAMKKGSKIRFANCPTKDKSANVGSKVLMVNGDHRIAIFAERDIAAGEELILDYRWDSEIQEKFGIKVPKKEPKKSKSRKMKN